VRERGWIFVAPAHTLRGTPHCGPSLAGGHDLMFVRFLGSLVLIASLGLVSCQAFINAF
jgi:hypothetical protein